MDNAFARLNQINVSDHLEKKGEFTYLSWPYAVAQLRLADPTAFWEVRRFDGAALPQDRDRLLRRGRRSPSRASRLSQIHPVLDGKNRPIFEPTAFDINTSIQRCLVKAIALHGLGLYVYAGEDLPERRGAAEGRPSTGHADPSVEDHHRRPAALPRSGCCRRPAGRAARLLDYFGVASVEELPDERVRPRARSRCKQAKRRAA